MVWAVAIDNNSATIVQIKRPDRLVEPESGPESLEFSALWPITLTGTLDLIGQAVEGLPNWIFKF